MDVINGINVAKKTLKSYVGHYTLSEFTISKRTSGGTKVLWLLAVLFISWFAWLAYILLVPKDQPIKRFANL